MPKNYYVILGIASGADPDEIKAAFRQRARELHPDTSGLESGPFLELQEAYGILGDPERRRLYDAQFRAPRVRRRPWGPSAEPLVTPRSVPEPFSPMADFDGFRDFGFEASLADFQPSFDELFDRLWSNFEDVSRPKAEGRENLTVEVVVTADEARRGGVVRVRVPARATCPSCGGQGSVGPYECRRCEGGGALTGEYSVSVRFPPEIQDSYAVQIPLADYGIENFYLTVLFRVTGG